MASAYFCQGHLPYSVQNLPDQTLANMLPTAVLPFKVQFLTRLLNSVKVAVVYSLNNDPLKCNEMCA